MTRPRSLFRVQTRIWIARLLRPRLWPSAPHHMSAPRTSLELGKALSLELRFLSREKGGGQGAEEPEVRTLPGSVLVPGSPTAENTLAPRSWEAWWEARLRAL